MNTSAVLEPVRARKQAAQEIKTLIAFLLLAFGLSWGTIAVLILFPDQITALFGEISSSNPLFILAVYAPGLAGIILIWRHYGLRGLGSFFRRLTLWRARSLVAVPHLWHSRHRLYRRRCERHDQRPVPLFSVVSDFTGANPIPAPWSCRRGIRLAGPRFASIAATICSVLGKSDSRHHRRSGMPLPSSSAGLPRVPGLSDLSFLDSSRLRSS